MTPPPAAGAAARPATGTPARRPVPGPRRVSGPARVRPVAAPAASPLRRVVDHRLLARLISGRAWIGIVAFALIGIVTMQVALLRLNAGIGRSVERAAALQRANSLLATEISGLEADNLNHVETATQSMVYDPAGDVRYLTAGNGDAATAAATMVPPAAGSSSSSAAISSPTSTASSAPASGGGAQTSGSTALAATSATATATAAGSGSSGALGATSAGGLAGGPVAGG